LEILTMNRDNLARRLAEAPTGSASIVLPDTDLADIRTVTPLAAGTGRDALDALADAYRDQARARPERHLAVAGDEAAEGAIRGDLGPMLAVLGDYGLSGTRATDVARGWARALQGFVVMELQGAVGSAAQTDRAFLRLIDMLDGHALAAAGRSRPGAVKPGRAGSRRRPEPAARHPSHVR
jgi:hypothetical protein